MTTDDPSESDPATPVDTPPGPASGVPAPPGAPTRWPQPRASGSPSPVTPPPMVTPPPTAFLPTNPYPPGGGPGGGYLPPTTAVPLAPMTLSETQTRTRTLKAASGESPLWYLVACIGLWVFAVAMVFVAVGISSDDDNAAVGPLVVAALAVAASALVSFLWIRRLGVNAGLFGGWLVLATILPWERLGFTGGTSSSLGMLQARVIISLLLGFASIVLFRRRLIVLTWRAGHLPAPVVAELTWILHLAAWALVSFPLANSVMNPVEVRTAFYVSYRFENPNMVLVGTGLVLGALSALLWLGALVAVTVVQHLDIRDARRELARGA